MLNALPAVPPGAAGAGTGAAGVGTVGDTEPALVGREGIAGAAAASVPPKAGGAGTALARIGTLSAATGTCADGASVLGGVLLGTLVASATAPCGGATVTLGIPLDTELKPCACVATNGVANAGNAVIARRFYSSPGVFAVSSLTPPAQWLRSRATTDETGVPAHRQKGRELSSPPLLVSSILESG